MPIKDFRLTDAFGRKYLFTSRKSFNGYAQIKAKPLHDIESARRFLRGFNKDDSYWSLIALQLDTGGAVNALQSALSRVAQALSRGKVSAFLVPTIDTQQFPLSKRSLKSPRGELVSFLHPSELIEKPAAQMVRFRRVDDAVSYLSSLNLSESQVDTIQHLLGKKTTKMGWQKNAPVDVTKISESLVNGELVIVSEKPATPKPKTETTEEAQKNLPGNRDAGLGPEPGDTAQATQPPPKSSILINLVSWNNANANDEALNGANWSMSSPVTKNGTGKVDAEVDAGIRAASVEITLPTPNRKVTKPVNAASRPDDYPQQLKHEQWEDELHGDLFSKDEDYKIECTFDVVEYDRWDTNQSLRSRLKNLGFRVTDVSQAVRAFQYTYLKNPNGSGQLADIKKDLMRVHDQP